MEDKDLEPRIQAERIIFQATINTQGDIQLWYPDGTDSIQGLMLVGILRQSLRVIEAQLDGVRDDDS